MTPHPVIPFPSTRILQDIQACVQDPGEVTSVEAKMDILGEAWQVILNTLSEGQELGSEWV